MTKVKIIDVDANFTKSHAESVEERFNIKNGEIREMVWHPANDVWCDVDTGFWFIPSSVEVQK